jgi:transposase-like protein
MRTRLRHTLRGEATAWRQRIQATLFHLGEPRLPDGMAGNRARGRAHPDRAAHRNGYRPRRWDTRAGELQLRIPKLRRGSYFPLVARAAALRAGPAERPSRPTSAGVSTRRVDQLVESLGLRISRSVVSRIAEGLDEQVEAFRTRPL